MRYVWSMREPKGTRVLLIESGPRGIAERTISLLRSSWAAEMPVDLLTCYGGRPQGLPAEARIFNVADYATPELRIKLLGELRDQQYACAGMICAAEPIMSRWKWWLAWKLPAKFFIINENADYFWLHRENAKSVRAFVLERAGLTGAGAMRTFGRLLIFPFAVLYLLLYAAAAHLGRALRLKSRQI